MTTKTMTNSKVVSKRVLMHGAMVVAAVTILLTAASSQALAQGNNTETKDTTRATTTASPNQGNLPTSPLYNITGSIQLSNTISSAIFSKVKTSLSDAITIAQRAVGTNTSATLAFIRPLNGYLVYDVHVRNNSNNTTTAVIVDAGNSKVLYKQTSPSLVFGNFGFGHYGMFGKGTKGPSFGGYGGSGGRGGFGFGEHGGGMMMGQSPHMGGMGPSPPNW